jgi:hypothetical protein
MKQYIAILLCLIFITGCTSSTPANQVKKVTSFIGGKAGLKASFIDGTPPAQVYDKGSSAFAIGLKIDNPGEYDITDTNGYVEVVGLNPQDFGMTSQASLKKAIPALRAAKKTTDGSVMEGDSQFVEFSGLKYLPDLRGNTEFKFRTNLCYDYVTMVSSKICINKNPLGVVGEAICKVSADKEVQNSGGPIQITKLKETPLGDNKVQLLFEIGPVGDTKDMFYKKGTDCINALTNSDRYKVYVKVTSDVNGVKPQCNGLEMATADSSEGYVTLFNGAKRAVTCSIDLAKVDSVFEELFTVDLSYRYHQYLDKTIEVQDIS